MDEQRSQHLLSQIKYKNEAPMRRKKQKMQLLTGQKLLLLIPLISATSHFISHIQRGRDEKIKEEKQNQKMAVVTIEAWFTNKKLRRVMNDNLGSMLVLKAFFRKLVTQVKIKRFNRSSTIISAFLISTYNTPVFAKHILKFRTRLIQIQVVVFCVISFLIFIFIIL